MKNGIAMISKLSSPVNSFIDTDSIGTLVRMKVKVSTVSTRAIDTGMPVTMKEMSRKKSVSARSHCGSTIVPVACATQMAKMQSGASISASASGFDQRLGTSPCGLVEGCSASV